MLTATAEVPTTADAPGSAEPPWAWRDAPIATLVRRIQQLQNERAQAFRRLDQAHRQYLRSGQHHDFPRYRSVVHEVTQVFAAASREVLAVEAELAGPRAQLMLARHVRSLQELEQTRLATVALLQVMGTPGVSGQEDPEKLRQLKIKVIKTMEAISEVLQELRFDAESAE
ncbi:required for excision 1-B domain-containing protein [Peromyscus maniculatus bairdii]|uniref:Required for excision 1-B domain containing n=1 Tax=Peromyscus maniculatus bairdii TaxID=230844 RepID=A0A6I9M450_PERMB|nr:required for excision 1-B domain-containing protein [Peromyscus maniculatus bairdii]